MEKKEFDIFELIRILLQNRVFIIVFVALSGIAAVIYSLLTPKIWESRASFYVVGQESTALPINIPGLGGLASQFLDSDNTQNSINAVSALKSRRFSEDVIRHFDLIKYFKISDKDPLVEMDIALKKLKINTAGFKLSKETGLVGISVQTKDKKLSKDMVDYYILKLDEYNRGQKLTRGKMNREFLEERVFATRATVDSLILAVKDFQQTNRAVDIQSQTSALISSYSDVIAAKMKVDIEHELALQNYAETSPLVVELKSRSQALAKQIRELETSSTKLKPQYLINISSLPDLGSQFAQLKMNLEIQSKVFEFLYPQFEAARLEELRDMPSIDILDSARESGLRLRPKRAMICIIAAALAFVLAVVIVLVKTVIQNNKDRITEIRNSL
ncbi:MAG: Wzz/FepE/Etk N-terminal domain-containing protein [Candidatus Cloacimonadaceae bacterium]|nr:Wzz/FepE/Etk N-terminal domain-containing protein [Candidatus Cloacimonadaceae bacterium]MDP3114853.1 Wzz/FepE/Etk N-terminal domain-containing protein [Candidatus Cloacimonadaceae bacterium]